MQNEDLKNKAVALCENAKSIKHPMLPAGIKAAIVGAAEIVLELVNREVNRNG